MSNQQFHPILAKVQTYLNQSLDGEATITDELVDEFGELCKKLLKERFTPKKQVAPGDKDYFGMGALGKPLCQQQMARNGAPRTRDSYESVMKFIIGDMIEAAAHVIMKGAGVNVTQYHPKLEIEIQGEKVLGIPDHVINEGREAVYDIKSASPYSFSKKFKAGFGAIAEDDAFGYIPQGYLYAEGLGLPFGGWIAIDKVSGEWCICEPPIADRSYKRDALAKASKAIEGLRDTSPNKPYVAIERCFDLENEMWRGKPTGNKYLGITCVYCPFKEHCWKDIGELNYLSQPRSQAQNPKKFWYVGDVND